MSSNLKDFKNPKGYWEHNGSFSVEVTDDADLSIVPPSVRIEGRKIIVRSGRVKQVMGGIQLTSEGKDFYWGYPWLKVIRDGNGKLLWVNYQYR